MRSLLFALAFAALAGGSALADCRVAKGSFVALVGNADDPDVLMWDSRDRLKQYEAGSADTRRFLLPHALLMRPGTRVKVGVCEANIVHPKFRFSAVDAIGVQVATGPFRGRYGWVSASDLEGAERPPSSQPW